MKTISCLIVICTGLFAISCKSDKTEVVKGKTLGPLYVSNEKPSPGDSLHITYTTEKEDPSAYLYYMVDEHMYPVDIPVKKVSEKWEGHVIIPDSATAITFRFKAEDEFDHNDNKGFVLPLYTKDGELRKSTLASMANFYQRYGKSFEVEVEKDSSLTLFEQEFAAHPDMVDTWDNTYAKMLYTQDKEKGKKWVEERIATYQSRESMTEDGYKQLIDLNNVIGKDSIADAIKDKAIAQYPKGKLAKNELMLKFYKEKDIKKKEELFKEFANSFDDADRKNAMLYVLANTYASEQDYETYSKYADQMPENDQKARLYNSVAWKLAEKGEKLDLASTVSKKSLDIITSLKQGLKDKPDYFSESQYKNSLDGSYRMYADTYALILFKQGQIKEAVKYQEEAIGEGKSPGNNERYIQFLLGDKDYAKAQEKAAEFIRDGASTTKMKDYIKTAYIENKGSEEGFDTYLEELEAVAHAAMLEETKKNKIDEEAPDFTLKNLKGEDVALSSLKGKTVILDFWATWCGPCKSSFPGMQKAVTKYKDDTNVEFLFIDTWESGKPEARLKKVKDFIDENNYTFHVLLDTPVEEGSRDFNIVNKYGVSGIPTKIIIGPEGRINFRSVGYSGNNEKLVKELDLMIELLQS